MAYVAPSNRTTGDLVTAAIWNQDVAANVIAIKALVDKIVVARQGGHATTWSEYGTTTYTPTQAIMQVGAASGGAGTGNISVTFPVAFSDEPVVIPTPVAGHILSLSAISNTGFTAALRLHDNSVDGNIQFITWLAIGPP